VPDAGLASMLSEMTFPSPTLIFLPQLRVVVDFLVAIERLRVGKCQT
jgi:hypothetical protein